MVVKELEPIFTFYGKIVFSLFYMGLWLYAFSHIGTSTSLTSLQFFTFSEVCLKQFTGGCQLYIVVKVCLSSNFLNPNFPYNSGVLFFFKKAL